MLLRNLDFSHEKILVENLTYKMILLGFENIFKFILSKI